jgi:DUF971 family protein
MDDKPLAPTSIARVGEALRIAWSDGRTGRVTFRKLRDACPCAACNEHREQPPDPFRVLSDRELQAGAPRPIAMPARGAYAYQIVWNDGHDTGIYKLEMLHQLCEWE